MSKTGVYFPFSVWNKTDKYPKLIRNVKTDKEIPKLINTKTDELCPNQGCALANLCFLLVFEFWELPYFSLFYRFALFYRFNILTLMQENPSISPPEAVFQGEFRGVFKVINNSCYIWTYISVVLHCKIFSVDGVNYFPPNYFAKTRLNWFFKKSNNTNYYINPGIFLAAGWTEIRFERPLCCVGYSGFFSSGFLDSSMFPWVWTWENFWWNHFGCPLN